MKILELTNFGFLAASGVMCRDMFYFYWVLAFPYFIGSTFYRFFIETFNTSFFDKSCLHMAAEAAMYQFLATHLFIIPFKLMLDEIKEVK